MCRCGCLTYCRRWFHLRRDARANLPHRLTSRPLCRIISGSRLYRLSLRHDRCRTCCRRRLDNLGNCRCGCSACCHRQLNLRRLANPNLPHCLTRRTLGSLIRGSQCFGLGCCRGRTRRLSRLDSFGKSRCGCRACCRRQLNLRFGASPNLSHRLKSRPLGLFNCFGLRGRRCRTYCRSRFDLRRDACANLPHRLTSRPLCRIISGSRLYRLSLRHDRCRTCCRRRLDNLGNVSLWMSGLLSPSA